jgi:hypothetical protein
MRHAPIALRPVLSATSEYFGVNPFAKTRRHRVVTARMIVTNYLMRNNNITNAMMCDIFNIPHTQVIYYLNRHDELMETNEVYRNHYLNFKQFLFNL